VAGRTAMVGLGDCHFVPGTRHAALGARKSEEKGERGGAEKSGGCGEGSVMRPLATLRHI